MADHQKKRAGRPVRGLAPLQCALLNQICELHDTGIVFTTLAVISAAVGKPRTHIRFALIKLVEKGYLEFMRIDRGGLYLPLKREDGSDYIEKRGVS